MNWDDNQRARRMMPPLTLTIKQAAALLRVSPSTVSRMIKRGEIEVFKPRSVSKRGRSQGRPAALILTIPFFERLGITDPELMALRLRSLDVD